MQRAVIILRLNWSLDVANRARIADRTIAFEATALTAVSGVQTLLNTLILSLSLVLLPGAVWMHAT
jgi:hypothetical protein